MAKAQTGAAPWADGRLGMALIVLFVLYLLFVAACRLCLHQHLEYDDAEQLLMAQTLEWGYSAQPPLYTWLVWVAVRIAGPTATSLTFVKTLIWAGVYWALARVAFRCTQDGTLAAFASLSPLLTPACAWELPRTTHTLLACLASLSTLLAVLRLHDRRRTADYLWLGVWVGLGFLSKYTYTVFLGSALGAAMLHRSFRTLFLDVRILLSIAVAVLLCLPHGAWLAGHWEDAVGRFTLRAAIDPSALAARWTGLVSFAVSVVAALGAVGAVWFALFCPCFRRVREPRPQDDAGRYVESMVLVASLGWLALILAAGVQHFRIHWGAPTLLLAPICCFRRLAGASLGRRRRLVYAGFLAAAMAGLALVSASLVVLARGSGKFQTRDFLFAEHSRQARAEGFEEGAVVALDPVLAGYLRLHFPRSSVLCTTHPACPAADARDGTRVMVVWDATPAASAPDEGVAFAKERLGPLSPVIEPRTVAAPAGPRPSSIRRLGYQLYERRGFQTARSPSSPLPPTR